jgi:hypothetical protein
MYTHKAIAKEITEPDFPADHLEENDKQWRRCSSFREAASIMPCKKLAPSRVTYFFKLSYNSFTGDTIVWYAHKENADHFEWPFLF